MPSINDEQASFYKSKEWKRTRLYIMEKYNYICQMCGGAAYIVHHIEHLNAHNVNDPYIALGEDNLTAVCLDCHNKLHFNEGITQDGLYFDDDGNLKQL